MSSSCARGAAFVCGVALCALLGAAPARAQGSAEWPDYRGPRRDGQVEGRLPLRWSETSGVAWKTAIPGRGWSTPVACGERLWLSNADEEGHRLTALEVDARSGKLLREIELFSIEKPQPCNGLNSYASPSPVSDGERVVFTFGAHGTVCLDSKTGARLWERKDLVCDHLEGPGSSPLLDGPRLVLLYDGGDVQFLVALDARTGETLWKRDRGVDYSGMPADVRKAFSTPILIEREGRSELVASCARATMGYAPSTGEELWRIVHPGFSMSARPVYGDGVLYFTTAFMRPEWWAVRAGPAPQDGRDGRDGRDGKDGADERVVWRHRRGAPTMPSPILHGELFFCSDDQGTLSCLEAATGEEVWRERLLGPVCASALLAGGQLLFCDREGKSVVLEAGREPKVLSENQLDAGCFASPVLLGSALFLRTTTHLYRIEGS